MVYLTPNVGIGKKAVDGLRAESCFRAQHDRVGQLGWDRLRGYLDQVASETGDGAAFLTSGFREIQAAIARATEVKFVLAGGREQIAAMAKRAVESLAERPATSGIAFHSWPSRTEHTLYTAGRKMTVYLKAQFDAEEEKPYHPCGAFLDGGLRLGLETEFGISGRGRKDPPVRAYWREITGRGVIYIPGLGEHVLTPQGWYQYRTQVAGSIEEVAAQLAGAGSAIVVALHPYFG
jgi:hypothetical protein